MHPHPAFPNVSFLINDFPSTRLAELRLLVVFMRTKSCLFCFHFRINPVSTANLGPLRTLYKFCILIHFSFSFFSRIPAAAITFPDGRPPPLLAGHRHHHQPPPSTLQAPLHLCFTTVDKYCAKNLLLFRIHDMTDQVWVVLD